jgi:hypothetical protein
MENDNFERIIDNSSLVCIFCGKDKKQKWDEYQKYYECDCSDAVKERKILEKIERLKLELPHPKYCFSEKILLYKND